MPDCPALADIATSPTLAAEVAVDRIPELLGEIERLRGRAVGAADFLGHWFGRLELPRSPRTGASGGSCTPN